MRTEGTPRILATEIWVIAIAACLVSTEARPFGIATRVSRAQPAIAAGSNGLKPVVFTDVTSAAKITWSHDNLATPEKYLIETMGGGGAFLDYDQDGLMDIYLVNSGPTPYHKPKSPIRNALYRNNGDGTFTDVTLKAGVAGGGFGLGVAVGDFNNDGFRILSWP